ncbi:hypothetical protein C8R46DRAFT_1221822 [Mycena filopes]|nr:hypothetical protein C8R46DRAFT_1221822 [Mycena filopes]
MTIEDDIIREAGRAVAERLLPTRRRDYDDSDRRDSRRDRDRSRSPPRSYNDGYGRRDYAGGPHANSDRGPRREHDRSGGAPPRRPPPGPRFQDRARSRDARRGSKDHPKPQRESSQERNLRQAALASRPADWVRVTFPPDALSSARDTSGHPIFPDKEIGEDDDDLSPLLELKAPVDYARRESDRRGKAVEAQRHGQSQRKMVTALTLENAGVWATAGPVATFPQAVNLMRWVYRGDKHVMEFMCAIMTRLGTDPTIPRTPGEVTVLQYQNQAMVQYKQTVYGGRAPSAQATAVHGPPRTVGTQETQKELMAPAAAPAPEPAPADIATMAMDEDTPMPIPTDIAPSTTEEPADPFATVPVFLGAAQLVIPDLTTVHIAEKPTDESMGRRGTTATLSQALRWYRNLPTSHWPHGFRVTPDEWVTTSGGVPWYLDVGAWFTLNSLIPKRDGTTSLHRASMLKATVLCLSVVGVYEHFAHEGEYPLNNLPLEHYPFDAGNIGFSQIVAWFMQHGIAPRSEALQALQFFARSRRNRIAGADGPNVEVFSMDWPNSASDIIQMILRPEDKWVDLHFGTCRAGVDTNFPSFPAGVTIENPTATLTVAMNNGQPFPALPSPSPGEVDELTEPTS